MDSATQMFGIANRYLENHLGSPSARAMVDVLSADPVAFYLTRMLGCASNFTHSYMVAAALKRPRPEGFSMAEYRTPAGWVREGVKLATDASQVSQAVAASIANADVKNEVTQKLETVKRLLDESRWS